MAKEWHISGYEKPESERSSDIDWMIFPEKLNNKGGAKLAFERGECRARLAFNVTVTHMECDAPVQSWEFINGEWI